MSVKNVLPVTKKIAAGCMSKRPFRVSVEGNIGSGKSTCIKYFSKFDSVDVHPEPLDKWRNVDGHNLLSLLYTDMKKWSFMFQHYVHLSRLQIQTSAPSSNKITVKMFERSVQNSRYCFVENAKKENFLQDPEYEVLMKWFDYTEENLDIGLDLIVYLRSTPEVALERIMKRGRKEESEIPLKYLQAVHDSYEQWITESNKLGCEVLTIDANQDINTVLNELDRHSYKILGGNYTY